MSIDLVPEAEMEPERYELYGDPAERWEMTRRAFFGVLGGGMVVLLWQEHEAQAAQDAGESGGGGRRAVGGPGRGLPQDIAAWLHIAEDGTVTVYTGKAEVGQDIRTSLTQAVAEELRAPVAAIKMVLGDTALCAFDRGTFGSRTTPIMNAQLRKVAAAARELLLDLASEQASGTERSALVAEEGKIHHPSTGRSWGFGELTRGHKLLKTVGEDTETTPAADWKIAGSSAPKVSGRTMVTGSHKYTSDLRLPGMLYGKVLRPATLGASLVSLDERAAEALPGVAFVRDGDFVGVAAPDLQTASRALAALKAQWKASGDAQPAIGDLPDYFRKHPGAVQPENFAEPVHAEGSVERGMAEADGAKREGAYGAAYIAHAPLEPRAALAEWGEDNKTLTVWTGTQRPFGVRGELAQAFGLPEERVRVIVPDTGSGYGGKHTGEAAIEAARLARGAKRPVKLVWTREEEFTWAYFRPGGAIDVRAGVRRDGTLTAWEFHNYNAGTAGIRTPYAVANQHIAFHPVPSPLRQGSYRALAATANNFARESHMDELAHALQMDPLAFRYRNLPEGRLRAVLDAAALRFGWEGRQRTASRGVGLACGTEKNGFVATCAEVEVGTGGEVRVVRAVTAFDCGAVVNPDNLRNQIEGAVVQGLGGALFEQIVFGEGKIQSDRFSRYRVPRFSDVPVLETVLVDRKDLPSSGAGECPIIALAPAVGNALFDATGVRFRSLPLAPHGVKARAD